MKNDFSRLKRKIFLQVLLIGGISLTIGFIIQFVLIDGILEEPFAYGFIRFCQRTFGLDYQGAWNIYFILFRSQKDFIMSAGLIILMMFIFYKALSRFTKYFNEVSVGMDKLVEETENDIKLSPEMNFMTDKINRIKDILGKRAKEAQDAEQRKNDLVVYLAHDIKTPLTSIIGYLNLLDEAPDMPMEQKAKYTKITLEKAYRLEHLINEFFEITRFNLQTIVLNKEEINLGYMLIQMADEFYPILSSQNKEVEVNIEEGFTIFGDADKLARVFNNILKNAIAYSYKNSTISISSKSDGDKNIVKFTNKGKPIPPQKLNTIFEKFYRLDSSRATKTGGTGLGLAIAKEIINVHEGSISVESNIDKTTFTVILPTHR